MSKNIRISFSFYRKNTWTIFVILVLLFLFLDFYLGLQKKMWLDEIATLVFTNVDSFKQFIRNNQSYGDLNPPLYYLIILSVRKIFPDTIVTYRTVSAIISLIGLFSITYLSKSILMIRHLPVVFFVLLLSWFFPFYLFIEFRSYGLFFLLFVIFTIFWFLIVNAKYPSNSRYICLGIVTVLLFYTHYFSFVFVAPLLLVLMIKKNRKEIYYALLFIFLFSLPLIPLIIEQLSVFNGFTWQEVPKIKLLVFFPFFFWGKLFFLFLGLMIIINYKKNRKIYLRLLNDKNLILYLVIVLSVPILVFILAQFEIVVFVDRYFVPTFIGLAVLFIIILDSLIFEIKNKIVIYLIMFILLGGYNANKFALSLEKEDMRTNKYLELDNSTMPVVCESPHVFYPLWYYSKNKNYFLVLDWKSSNQKGNVKNAVFDYLGNQRIKEIQSIPNIINWDEFITKYNKFYLINETGRKLFETKIEGIGTFNIEEIDSTIFLIEKINE